jgi:hypothetical protein
MSTQVLQLNHAKGGSLVQAKSEPVAQGADCASAPAGIELRPMSEFPLTIAEGSYQRSRLAILEIMDHRELAVRIPYKGTRMAGQLQKTAHQAANREGFAVETRRDKTHVWIRFAHIISEERKHAARDTYKHMRQGK